MLTTGEIQGKIEAGLPGASVMVLDPNNDGKHLKAVVIFTGFKGKTLLDQHRMVYHLLRDEIEKDAIHALALETKVN